jgi:hypothetical protein
LLDRAKEGGSLRMSFTDAVGGASSSGSMGLRLPSRQTPKEGEDRTRTSRSKTSTPCRTL